MGVMLVKSSLRDYISRTLNRILIYLLFFITSIFILLDVRSLIFKGVIFHMWKFRKLGEGEPERSPHEAEFFNVGDLDASASLVRESIQNSLDARLNFENPVHVNFILGSEPKKKFGQYYSDLLSHVQSCGFKLDSANKDLFTYLVIEDFGTRGLDGPITRTEVSYDQKSNY